MTDEANNPLHELTAGFTRHTEPVADPIERMATAWCRHFGQDFNKLATSDQAVVLNGARAAVEALLEPSEAMIDSGVALWELTGDPMVIKAARDEITTIFQVIINAALERPKPTRFTYPCGCVASGSLVVGRCPVHGAP